MSLTNRRLLYGALATLGLGLMVPYSLRMRVWQARFMQDPADVAVATEPLNWVGLALLALVGLTLATAGLYLALSTGYARAWRPEEDEEIRCRRCGSEVGFGVRICPVCDQRFVW